MLQCHAVCIAREAQRQRCHVEKAVLDAAQLFKPCRALSTKDADGLLKRKAIVACWHRRMRGEDALGLHSCNISLQNWKVRAAAHLPFQQRQCQQRCVAFVHVIYIHAQAQRMEQAHTAHAQDNLLLQAIVRIAAIEMVGQAAVPRCIAFNICIEQKDRHHVDRNGQLRHNAMRAP